MARTFVLADETLVHAPIERCFRLSTSLAIVERELKMRPVAGRTKGFVTRGDTVLWKGWQLGLPQFHESLIEPFNAPTFFRDQMITGRFRSFQHDHHLTELAGGTVMLRDELQFSMPLGGLGALVGRWIMVPHIRGLLRRRFRLIRQLAETDGWKQYLPSEEDARSGIRADKNPTEQVNEVG